MAAVYLIGSAQRGSLVALHIQAKEDDFQIDADQSCRPISAVEIVASSLKSVP
jgi:hypothetical protein